MLTSFMLKFIRSARSLEARKKSIHFLCVIRGITRLLFLSMHNASLMTYPAGPQLNSVLFAWMARDNARRPISHATTPRRCYLFNLRVLLRAMFSLVAARFISATIVSCIFNVGDIGEYPVQSRVPLFRIFVIANSARICATRQRSVRRNRLHAELLPSH